MQLKVLPWNCNLKMHRKISLVLKILASVLVCFICGVYLFWVDACGSVDSYGTGHTERIEIPSGMTVRQAAHLLKEKGLINNEKVFYLAARFPFLDKSAMHGFQSSSSFELKSGVYQVSSEFELSEIFSLLSSGQQEYIKLVVAEGLTINKIAGKIEQSRVCSRSDFIEAASSPELLKKYNISARSFEGYLFPDTYFLTPEMTGKEIVCIMADNFFEKMAEIEAFKGLSNQQLNEKIVLASIVEKEYRVASEAPLIASVFKNRLKRNMGLYSCATIEYIITEIQGKPHPKVITYDDLKIKSPYNTYMWAGLPPGPISNPGMTALMAVAETPKTNYYYFRLTDAEKGIHSFSADFEKHLAEGQVL